MTITVPSLDDYEALSQRLAAIEALTEDWDSIVDVDASGISRLKPTIWHANSGHSSERVTSLPISGLPAPSYHVVYSVQLPALADGDLIEAYGSFEATNPYSFVVMVCRTIRICDSAISPTGIEMSEEACQNIPNEVHHGVYADAGSIRATSAMSGKFVNLVACANVYNVTGSAVIVEQDYGRLIVKVTRRAALEVG